jgi:pimeloyl-ACP methyl ester carboxylesterase
MVRLLRCGAAVIISATMWSVGAQIATAAPRSGLSVGTVSMHRCDLGTDRTAWCGSIQTPLDYPDARAGTITIGFGWLPSAQSPRGTVVAQEGGPGYPSTGTAADYADMLGGLLQHRNMLVVDARGTGRSTPIDCEPLQSLPAPSSRFTAAVTACGRTLNHTFPRAGGGYVHASDLFSTANSVRDLARVIGALRLGKVDYYGDSYGTYFGQSLLAHYPQLLRSVVLDSAYEARDLDPWYRTTVTTARRAFDAVCRRAIGCPSGSVWHRIGLLADALRAHPVSGRVVGTDAAVHSVTVDVTALVNIVNDAGYDTDPYRQLDAAARAYLEHHYAAPLLRLYAQDVGYDYSDYYADADYYSDGLYMAVACTDYPQLFDMRATPAVRRQQLDASIATLPAKTFAPFSTREWLGVLPYTETYTGCLTWPAPTHPADPPVPDGVPMDATNVPVLILNGELDSLTPAAGGAHIARQIGPAAHAYVAANNVHLVALDSGYDCGPHVVRQFLREPNTQPDTSCLASIPPIRAVPNFPATLAQVTPAIGRAPVTVRRLVSVAVAEAGDALIRYNYVDGQRDRGLNGGRVRYDADGNATLRDVRYTMDTRVSGTARHTADGVMADLTVRGPGGGAVHVTARWGAGRWAVVTTDAGRLRVPAP